MDNIKFRPCMLFEKGKRGSNKVVVHLMASFERSEEVPKVFQRFMAEISTSSRSFNDHKQHLHASPEWRSNSRQWIITLATSIQGVNLSRWRKSGKTGYHFSEPMLNQFREIINDHTRAWNEDVQSDPGFVHQYVRSSSRNTR